MKKQAVTYGEISPLIELCKAGRLFEVQDWIAAGKPVNLPDPVPKKPGKRSPLQIAIDSGFHSLVQVLLQGGAAVEEPRYSPLPHALGLRRLDLVKLLVSNGADIHSVSMGQVFDTWNNEIVEFFISQGADLETDNPLAEALCSRIRTALAIFKRYQDRVPSFQEQVNIALRYHCKEGNLKWVSLMLWASGDPYAKGQDSPFGSDSDDECSSALELAALYDHFEIFTLKAIRLDPAHPVAGELLRNACFSKDSSILKKLLEKGFSPRDLEDKGSSLIQSLLCRIYRYYSRWSFKTERDNIDTSDAHEIIKMIHMLVRHGARWEPREKGEISYARRSLLKMIPEYTMEFVWIMSEYRASTRETIAELIKHPAMRSLISKHTSRLNKLVEALEDRGE